MSETNISWTDYSFNPWIGCNKVSEGCKFCYAEEFVARRLAVRMVRSDGVVTEKFWGDKAPRRFRPETAWKDPIKWDRTAERQGVRRKVFCASLADVFEDRPDLETPRRRLWETIRATPNLDWQLLTKRPENITRLLPADWGVNVNGYPNVWLGVSAENQSRWNERVPVLCQIPARVHFVSYEPALGRVDPASTYPLVPEWVICGGESGLHRRGFDPEWAREMRDQCRSLGIAFWFKQGSHRFPGKQTELDGETIHDFPDRQRVPGAFT